MKHGHLCMVILVLAASQALGGRESPSPSEGKRVLQTFDYRGVTLDSGPLRTQFDETRDYYLRIPNDDLLKGFRARAGLPSPGADLGGWYTGDIFHVFGQIVSGLSRTYAASGDPACKEKVDVLISEWGKCIAKDGYFYYSQKPNAPHYIYDKMVCGLVDAYLYCGNEEALGNLSKITAWAHKNLSRENEYAFNSGMGPTEWYTLSENLYRAYIATGDQRYRDFARVWEYTDFWKHFAEKRDIFTAPPCRDHYHAYSHVNSLSGAAAAYQVTGERWYLDAIRNAYDYLQDNQNFVTGGFGPDEKLLPASELTATLEHSVNHFESECGSWAGFKLAKYLISFTGDARYGDWIECLALNGIGAVIPMTPDGKPDYYSEYNVGGSAKRSFPAAWGCCAGTRPQAIADYHDLIYFRDAESLYVNLFAGSTVKWVHEGREITVRQITRFPEAETTELTVSVGKPTKFALKARVPGWLSSPMKASVNGKAMAAKTGSRHWAEFRREWRDGDTLTIRLPMGFRLARFPATSTSEFPTAVLRGPVVLAMRSTEGNPGRLLDFKHLDATFTSSPGEPLTYRLASDPNVLVRPFYAFKEGEQYFVYLDPSMTGIRYPHSAAHFAGEWGEAADFRMTKAPGSSVTFSFEGTGIRWVGRRFDDAGKAEVRIDGEIAEVVDQYGPGRGLPFKWERLSLSPGPHEIVLTLLPERNPESKDCYINVAAFDVLR